MAWVKIDDQAPRNHKLLSAGPAAAWLWVCGIAHCQAHMSEGFIADVALPMIGVTGATRARKLAAMLIAVGLFEPVKGGYMVHDYLDFNETREQAVARKVSLTAKRVMAGRAGGLAKVANAKQTVVADSSPDPTRPDPTLLKTPQPPTGAVRRRRTEKHLGGSVCGHEPVCRTTAACIALTLGRQEVS